MRPRGPMKQEASQPVPLTAIDPSSAGPTPAMPKPSNIHATSPGMAACRLY